MTALDERLAGYLAVRRALGYRLARAEKLLAQFVAWMSEILVGAIQPAAASVGLSSAFVAIFVVAILGNAAEHATARLNPDD